MASATAGAQASAITLKGSTATVTEFFGAWALACAPTVRPHAPHAPR